MTLSVRGLFVMQKVQFDSICSDSLVSKQDKTLPSRFLFSMNSPCRSRRRFAMVSRYRRSVRFNLVINALETNVLHVMPEIRGF
jgi:hypothetical protein